MIYDILYIYEVKIAYKVYIRYTKFLNLHNSSTYLTKARIVVICTCTVCTRINQIY